MGVATSLVVARRAGSFWMSLAIIFHQRWSASLKYNKISE